MSKEKEEPAAYLHFTEQRKAEIIHICEVARTKGNVNDATIAINLYRDIEKSANEIAQAKIKKEEEAKKAEKKPAKGKKE